MLHLTLTPTQLATIEMLLDRPPADIPVQRLQIVLLAAQGMKAPKIVKTVGLHEITVRKWIHRYEEKGIDGLRNQGKAPGRPRTLTPQQRAEIKRLYATEPRKLGLPFTEWTLKRMREYLISTGLVKTISHETLRTYINEAKK